MFRHIGITLCHHKMECNIWNSPKSEFHTGAFWQTVYAVRQSYRIFITFVVSFPDPTQDLPGSQVKFIQESIKILDCLVFLCQHKVECVWVGLLVKALLDWVLCNKRWIMKAQVASYMSRRKRNETMKDCWNRLHSQLQELHPNITNIHPIYWRSYGEQILCQREEYPGEICWMFSLRNSLLCSLSLGIIIISHNGIVSAVS
jgi:hypothetical protein